MTVRLHVERPSGPICCGGDGLLVLVANYPNPYTGSAERASRMYNRFSTLSLRWNRWRLRCQIELNVGSPVRFE